MQPQQQSQENPESTYFGQQFCCRHPDLPIKYFCMQQHTGLSASEFYYCSHQQCLQKHKHPHEDIRATIKQKLTQLNTQIRGHLDQHFKDFRRAIGKQLDDLEHQIRGFYRYTTLDNEQSMSPKEFIDAMFRARKDILAISRIKDEICRSNLQQLEKGLRDQIKAINFTQHEKELAYHLKPTPWKFSLDHTHDLLTIVQNSTSVQKKSQKPCSCAAILNKPLLPFENSIKFSINGQGVSHNNNIILGVCLRNKLSLKSYAISLTEDLFGIYQASGKSHNAYSLHGTNPKYSYKESVGWNFKAGDTVQLTITEEGKGFELVFKKRKEVFSMPLQIYEGDLYYPFVGLYNPGDKVSIDYE